MKGLIHIYCGDGKGKTTASMGLTVRALGSGMKVVLTQFMKGDYSSELKILREVPNLQLVFCEKNFGFVWNMTEEEKAEAKAAYTRQFETAVQLAVESDADMLVMDEFMSCYELQFIDNEKALEFLKNKPEKLAWSSGLHRYIKDSVAASMLKDIAEVKKGTEDEILAQEFFEHFCEINGLNSEDFPVLEGALNYHSRLLY